MRRRRLLATAAVALLARPARAAERAVPQAQVTIDNFTFTPQRLTVAAGTRVTWTNRDDIPHTVVSRDDPRAMRSPVLDTDDSFAFTFATPGTFAVFCTLHPHMQATVVVQ